MKFIYQARTKQGEVRSGTIDASSEKSALSILQKNNLFVTALESSVKQSALGKEITLFQRVSRIDIVNFSRQLAIMVKSDVSLVESLEAIAGQVKKTVFREKLLRLSNEIKAGSSFSKALSTEKKIFSQFYISMIKSGEASGSLSESLDYLAEHLEREYELTASIKGALVYPTLILLTMVGVLSIMMIFVVPNLTEVLTASGLELPLITKIVIKVSDILASYAIYLFLFVIFLGVIGAKFFKTKKGLTILNKIFLKIPILKNFFKKVYLSTFAENLSTLISGGVPIAQALKISAEVVSSPVYKKVIKIAEKKVQQGETISSALLEYPELFPSMFCQMISVGEKTGSLDKTLMNVVGFYQKEVDRAIKSMLSILEPLLIVVLAGVVGIIMAAILLPMYQMVNL